MAQIKSVRMPSVAVPILQRFADLPVARQREFVGAITSAPLLLSPSKLTDLIESNPGFDQEDASQFVSNLFSLSALAVTHGYDLEALLTDISSSSQLNVTAAKQARFVSSLHELITSNAIRGLARAIDVSSERDRILHTARILTDMRPVFDETAAEPIGAVAIHTLKLDVLHDGRITSILVSLDSGDLDTLQDAIDRARSKESAVDSILTRLKLPRFIIDQEGDD